jgi:hypothetical protein
MEIPAQIFWLETTPNARASLSASKRRIFRDVFWILPFLMLAVLAFFSGMVFAAPSVLEITPEAADSAVPPQLSSEANVSRSASDKSSGTVNSTPNRDLATAANDSDDDDDDDDDDQAASKNSSVPIKTAGASSSAAGDDKSSNSAQRDVADDDSDDDDEDDDDAPAHDNRPALETRIDRYRDSDHNDTLTTTSILSAPLGEYFVTVRREAVQAHDPLGAERVEASVISIHKDLSETFALSGGFGSYRTNRYDDFAGSVEAHWNIADWSISASIARDLLVKSAQSIRSNIRQTDLGLIASYDLTKQLSSDFEFHHKLYSDGNSSNELTFSPVYEFALERSQLDFGYSFNYQSFALAANHGYYDPRRLISNGLTGTWKFDRERYYGNFEASEGYADIKGASGGLGAANSAICTSVVATLGLRPGKDTSVEGYWSGERSAVWSSSALGVRIRYSF